MKARLVYIAVASLAISACSSMHMPKIWPFYKKPKPVPEAVHELDLVNADGTPASYPQYWKRNTLVIDLSGASGTGSVTARLPAETTWPVRVAVRVQPGSVQQIEVQGEERSVLPVAPEGVDAHGPRIRAQRVLGRRPRLSTSTGATCRSSRKP